MREGCSKVSVACDGKILENQEPRSAWFKYLEDSPFLDHCHHPVREGIQSSSCFGSALEAIDDPAWEPQLCSAAQRLGNCAFAEEPGGSPAFLSPTDASKDRVKRNLTAHGLDSSLRKWTIDSLLSRCLESATSCAERLANVGIEGGSRTRPCHRSRI